MRKLFPLLLIIAAGCGTTGRNMFKPASNAGCAKAPCDASCDCNPTAGQVMMNEHQVAAPPIYAE